MISSVLTVSQVNVFLKSLIESDGRLNDFFMSGEISNFTDHYRSGHLYFSLKDEKCVIKAVMFSSAAAKLKFKPKDGMKVIVRGRVAVYEQSGQYQFYVQSIQPEGIGAAALAFEQLKEKLGSEGIFDEDLKKSLPVFPKKIGLITSQTGAAFHDIVSVLNRRWPIAEIVLYPAQVQGESAAFQLTEALINMDKADCDVIIIGRGGGSYEDLQAFNDENLARTIFACKTPIVSAVGHETDFTICDFTADLRAPTPSAAAELCAPDKNEIANMLLGYHEYFCKNAQQEIEYTKQNLDLILKDSHILNPNQLFDNLGERVKDLSDKLLSLVKDKTEKCKTKAQIDFAKLSALDPMKVLTRGYAVVENENKKILSSVESVSKGDNITIKFSDGEILAQVKVKGEITG